MERKSQKGSFRSVRTSDDVENCFRVKISTNYEGTARCLRKLQKGSSHI